MEALHANDAALAEQLLVYAGLVVPRRDLVLNVLAPLLRQVGDEWEHGVSASGKSICSRPSF